MFSRLIFVVAILFLLVLVAGGGTSKAPKTLEAEKFSLVGADGQQRAVLSSAADGSSSLTFYQNGSPKLGMFVLSNGDSIIDFRDKDSKGRLRLGVGPDGSPVMSFVDKDGETSALGLTIKPDGTPNVIIGRPGQDSVALFTSVDGSGHFAVINREGKPRIGLGTSPNGNVSASLCDQMGNVRTRIGISGDGIPWTKISGKDGRGRVELGFSPEGNPKIQLFDVGGEVKFKSNDN